MGKYSKEELKEKAGIVFGRHNKEEKVFAFADGNVFLGSKKNAAERHKKETSLDYYTIRKEELAVEATKLQAAPKPKEEAEEQEAPKAEATDKKPAQGKK